MLKTFLIPILALTLAASGCSADGRPAVGDGSTPAADGSTAGAGAPGADASSDGDAGFPVCNLETFCPVYLAYCGTTTPGYTTLAECMTTFAAVGATNPYGQQCESEHLCIAIFDTGSDRTLHCSHAAGGGGVCVISPI